MYIIIDYEVIEISTVVVKDSSINSTLFGLVLSYSGYSADIVEFERIPIIS